MKWCGRLVNQGRRVRCGAVGELRSRRVALSYTGHDWVRTLFHKLFGVSTSCDPSTEKTGQVLVRTPATIKAAISGELRGDVRRSEIRLRKGVGVNQKVTLP